MRPVREQVHDRDVDDRRHALEHAVVEHPRRDDRVVGGQRAGDVLRRLPLVDADLVGPDRDRVSAESDHRHLAAVARPGRRLLEHERDAAAGEHRRHERRRRPSTPSSCRAASPSSAWVSSSTSRKSRSRAHARDLLRGRRARIATPRSISSSVTSSGGAKPQRRRRDRVEHQTRVEAARPRPARPRCPARARPRRAVRRRGRRRRRAARAARP